MSKCVLTYEEGKIAESYLKFCKDFGLSPTKDYEDKIANYSRMKRNKIDISDFKQEAIDIYTKRCNDLGFNVCQNIHTKTVAQIWDYIIRDTNIAVEKEFNEELSKIENIYFRKKARIVIDALYDEEIYVTREETKTLFNKAKELSKLKIDDLNFDEMRKLIQAAFESEYHKLGGSEGRLLALSEMASFNEEIEEEEGKEDEENYEG